MKRFYITNITLLNCWWQSIAVNMKPKEGAQIVKEVCEYVAL